MKRIKKKIIVGFSVIVITAMLFSCQKSNTKEKEEVLSDEKIISIFSQIGEIHNSGLDYVFTDLQKQNLTLVNGNNSINNHDKIYKLIDNSVTEFAYKSLKIKSIDLSPFIEKNNTGNPIKEYLYKDLVSQIKSLKQAEGLSIAFLRLMAELNALVDKNASKIEFDNLMKNGILTLNDFDEKAKFVSCTSIGFSSLQYWKRNVSKWKQMLSSGNLQTTTKVSSDLNEIRVIYTVPADDPGKAIGKADITGIITGAVGGCVIGAAGGTTVLPVVGTITGCAALGSAGAITVGLGNSAKAAVESFVNWLTK